MRTRKIIEYVTKNMQGVNDCKELIECMKRDKKEELKRNGELRAFISWMQGIPTEFPAGFETWEQEEKLKEWDLSVPKDDMETMEKFYIAIYKAIKQA